ncbi:MFS transporter [Microlunatus soli]|uniref:MFS transporter, putative metabolite transport protein n=1 Tax=Microlunatus soli TaxID=630515 RepID=A0A1H1U7I8_9ACTN|nr:MFS transporter [Microlunatus soli]SDS68317.1 MFS transporter, putative metabolite transport protein [Microlunatus soli]
MTTTSPTTFDSGPLTRGQRRIALTAVGGYFVDGYDLLVLGGALLAIKPELGLSAGQVGMLTAAAFVGMAVGSPISGPLTDRFGRKPIFFTAMVLFVVGSALTLAVPSLAPLIALRFVIGLAIGADMPPSAALIAEFIPSQRRGTFTGLGGVAWMLGGVLAIGVTLAIYTAFGNEDHWRWVLATGAIPALVLLFLRHKTPESPHWLESRGRHQDAVAAWQYAQGSEPDTAPGHRPVSAAAPTPLRALFRRPFGWLMLCICVFWGFNNLYGSAILLYQPTLITRIVTPKTYTALLFTGATLLIAGVVGTIVCLYLIESLGRRFVALGCLTLLIIACLLIYFGIGVAALVLVAFGAAIAVINGGTSIAFYAWAPELFPTAIRGRAVGLANMIGKAGSVLGTLALPTLYESVGNTIFMIIAVAAAINLAVVFLLAPETKGRSLDDLARGVTRFGHRR